MSATEAATNVELPAPGVSPTSDDTFSLHLLQLPTEVRLHIYEYVFEGAETAYEQLEEGDDAVVAFDATNTSDHRNILMVSKACHREGFRLHRRTAALRLMDGEWSLMDIQALLAQEILDHLRELRLNPFGTVSIEDALVARTIFQNLRLIKVNTFDELIWGPTILDDADFWIEMDMQSALDQVVPGFTIGNTISGIHVQGEIYLVAECITCDDCDGCDNTFDRLLLVDYSTRTILSG